MSSSTTEQQPEAATSLDQEQPSVLTAEEVATLLRVSRKSVYAAFKKGEIPGGRRIGAVPPILTRASAKMAR